MLRALTLVFLLSLGSIPAIAQTDTVRTDSAYIAIRGDTTLYGHLTTFVVTSRFRVVVVDSVRVAPPPLAGKGVPFGCSGCLGSGLPVTMSLDGYTAGNILAQIGRGRAQGIRLMLNMTGGSHDNYKTGGRFDVAKWQAKMATYNTPAIRAAVAAAVSDGTIIGNSVMDEPQQEGTSSKSWGPRGWMTKTTVDDLCGRVKAIFPTLPVGVVHDYSKFYPETFYSTCDFLGSQYRLSKGSATSYVANSAAWTAQSGMALILMLNYLHGGTPGTSCPKYADAAGTTLCPMSAAQVKQWGLAFGAASCAVGGFRYEAAYFAAADIRAAVKFVADSLARLPTRPCRRASPIALSSLP